MVGQQRQQIPELQFDKFPTSSKLSCWKIRFKSQATACSDFPLEAMLWIKAVEMVDSLDEFKFSRSVSEKNFPKFEMLDAKIASSLNKIIQNSQFKKRVSFEEQKAQKEDRFLRGRQIAFMNNDYFRVTGARDTVLDYADFFSVTLHDDNIQEFHTRWDEVLPSMCKMLSDDILESPYKLRIRESANQKLKTMVKRSFDQKLRLRNFDARHGRLESGAVIKSRKGLSVVEGGKGICYQWKEKGQCSKGDQCSFRHESNNRAQKPEPKAATPSEPSMSRGRRVSRKRSIRGKRNHGAIIRPLRRYYLKGTCTRSPCEHWRPPERHFHKTETGCKAGDKCSFPHHKVDEQPKKKRKKERPVPQKKRKRR